LYPELILPTSWGVRLLNDIEWIFSSSQLGELTSTALCALAKVPHTSIPQEVQTGLFGGFESYLRKLISSKPQTTGMATPVSVYALVRSFARLEMLVLLA